MAEDSGLRWVEVAMCLTCTPLVTVDECSGGDDHEHVEGHGLQYVDATTGEVTNLAWYATAALVDLGARVAAETLTELEALGARPLG